MQYNVCYAPAAKQIQGYQIIRDIEAPLMQDEVSEGFSIPTPTYDIIPPDRPTVQMQCM